jgi:predicted transcriptional regulator of viral defense system
MRLSIELILKSTWRIAAARLRRNEPPWLLGSAAAGLSYASKAKSVPAFKRMGFVCEAVKGPDALRDGCLRAVTLGLAKLDPAVESPRISKRWRLRLPKAWEKLIRDG